MELAHQVERHQWQRRGDGERQHHHDQEARAIFPFLPDGDEGPQGGTVHVIVWPPALAWVVSECGRTRVSDEQPLRFGILGCGVVAGAHAAAIAGLPEAKLVAVADPVTERAIALAEQYHATAYDSLTGMLN